jgi:choline kinase
MEDLPAAAIPSGSGHAHPHGHQSSHHDKLLSQVSEWLQAEKAKRAARKSKKTHNIGADGDAEIAASRERSGSQSSDSSVLSLEKLQRILEDNMAAFGHETLPSDASSTSLAPRRPSVLGGPRKRPSSRTLALNRTASSDTEYHDGDVVVPSCDEVLDNSKTLSYTGGAAVSTSDLATTSKRAEKERKAWSVFKNEILRLAHTLRLKGWRRVPLDRGDDIEVERLSGALTNAVYVVSPPTHLPAATDNAATAPVSKKPPPKLLLRIYGPQVEHLIDRENELGILRRLARKKIGPRLLGTFKNGRFEEYFESTTLTSADLRVPETSKQIAKRMRELHEGIDLLAQEREDGPFVWRNWDKWVERCEKVISFLDAQILSGEPSKGGKGDAWKENGLICGVEWPHFRAMVDKYRQYVVDYYGGPGKVAERLVFAHNDVSFLYIPSLSACSPYTL